MNYKKLTVGIVTYKSENVIFQCIKSLEGFKNIIILDTSNDENLKNKIKKKYPRIKFILSKENLGFGVGSNKIASLCKTEYLFLISPDVRLNKYCIKNLLKASRSLNDNFYVLSPASKDKNFGYLKKNIFKKNTNIVEIDYVKGFAMFLNLKKFKKIKLFDKNIFLYLEEIDLCKRILKDKGKIYLVKNAISRHLGGKSSNIGFEYEKCRNWHWMWSKTYFNFKYKNFLYSLANSLFDILTNLIKCILYFMINNKKSQLCYLRFLGTLNSTIRNKSYYRPKIN